MQYKAKKLDFKDIKEGSKLLLKDLDIAPVRNYARRNAYGRVTPSAESINWKIYGE